MSLQVHGMSLTLHSSLGILELVLILLGGYISSTDILYLYIVSFNMESPMLSADGVCPYTGPSHIKEFLPQLGQAPS